MNDPSIWTAAVNLHQMYKFAIVVVYRKTLAVLEAELSDPIHGFLRNSVGADTTRAGSEHKRVRTALRIFDVTEDDPSARVRIGGMH